MAKIRKGDLVSVLSGKDKGKTGKVLRIFPAQERALVESINMAKHFDRRSQENPSGGVVERETPIPLCKLALLAPKTQKPARVGWRVDTAGSKTRINRKTGDSIEGK